MKTARKNHKLPRAAHRDKTERPQTGLLPSEQHSLEGWEPTSVDVNCHLEGASDASAAARRDGSNAASRMVDLGKGIAVALSGLSAATIKVCYP